MKYDTVIFDLDGTILDTLEDMTDSVNVMLEGGDYPLRTRDEVRSFVGEGYRKLISKALPAASSEEEIDRCTGIYRKIYSENMTNKTKAYEGILPLFEELRRMRIKIGVVSNKKDEAVKETCNHYFGDYIDVAIGDNPLRKRKPAPDNVYEALKQLKSEKATSLFVGDSEIDVLTAQNAGLVCVGVTWGFRSRQVLESAGPDFIIDRPEELLKHFI